MRDARHAEVAITARSLRSSELRYAYSGRPSRYHILFTRGLARSGPWRRSRILAIEEVSRHAGRRIFPASTIRRLKRARGVRAICRRGDVESPPGRRREDASSLQRGGLRQRRCAQTRAIAHTSPREAIALPPIVRSRAFPFGGRIDRDTDDKCDDDGEGGEVRARLRLAGPRRWLRYAAIRG